MLLLDIDHGFFSNFLYTIDTQRSIIHEDINNNPTLLVTIGDSWTWGDSIDGINPFTKKDSPKRLTSVYGHHLKNLIGNCDWINIGYPGSANGWIVDVALRFDQIQKLTNYKHIIICVGLTDIGRDIAQKQASYDTSVSFDQNAENIEKYQLNSLEPLQRNSNITLLVGRNFTSTFITNKSIIKHHLPNRWIDISKNNWKPDHGLPECFTLMYPLLTSLADKETALKYWIPATEKIVDFLIECPLHYKIASKHPTEECHILWANYVYNYICTESNVKHNALNVA